LYEALDLILFGLKCLRPVRYYPNSGAKADIQVLRICANKRQSPTRSPRRPLQEAIAAG